MIAAEINWHNSLNLYECSKFPFSGSAGNIICPVDQSIILPNQVFPDVYAKREVLNIPVFCNYHENGCQWKGTIRDFEVGGMNFTLIFMILCL